MGADGVESWTRAALGLASTAKRYPETALVANFRCEKRTRGVARQWFRPDGILAWLPLPGDRLSIVWSGRGETWPAISRRSTRRNSRAGYAMRAVRRPAR